MPKTLYLIDGHAQIFRAFYAVEHLTGPAGQPTGAVYGFTRMLLDVLNRRTPDGIVAVFDAPGKCFRHEMYAEYKATRKPTPPELIAQIPAIQQIVAAYRIPVFSVPGFEADDVIGTLVGQATAAGAQVVIVTGDKDCGQLLGPGVSLWDSQRDRTTTAESFREAKGIEPGQLPDLMGLWGDTSDNIPGVEGVGEKTGAQLIAKYGSLEALYEHAAEIPGKRGETIRASREAALLSKRLATIRRDVPVALDLAASAPQPPDRERLAGLFEAHGFRSLLASLGGAPAKAETARDYRLVDSTAAFEDFWRKLTERRRFSFDTESTGLDPLRAELVGMSFCWEEGQAWYLPFRAPEGAPVLGPAELSRVGHVLADPAFAKVGQNLKYDALLLRGAGLELRGVEFDTLLASNLLEGHLREHNLDALARKHLGLEKIPTESLLGTGKKQVTMDAVEVARVRDYACEDADAVWRLVPRLEAELAKTGDRPLLESLELPLAVVLADMQTAGIRVDCALLARQSAELGAVLEDLTAEIRALAGRDFNLDSPKQLAVILFDELKLPVVHRTATGPSTDEETLQELASVHGAEIARRLLDYRSYAKLKNTYLDALPELVHPVTGRIHTTFSQTATATGRLSSQNPNLQNIPVRTEKGRAIRAAFVPDPGHRLLVADYSQIELRMLAHFAGDAALRRAFAEGRDIHAAVAAEVFGPAEGERAKENRARAKAINFGIVYGQGAHGLAQTTGMTRGEAQRFIDDYFGRFPGVKGWIEGSIREARAAGGAKTILGRRRSIPDLASNNKAKAGRAEREAVNTVLQGSAADLIKTAMIALHRRLPTEAPGCRMLLQIHDELVFEGPPEALPALRTLVRDAMENALPLEVPVAVEIGEGANWLEAK